MGQQNYVGTFHQSMFFQACTYPLGEYFYFLIGEDNGDGRFEHDPIMSCNYN